MEIRPAFLVVVFGIASGFGLANADGPAAGQRLAQGNLISTQISVAKLQLQKSVVLSIAAAKGGGMDGGGGDGVSQEFIELGRQLIKKVLDHRGALSINLDALSDAILGSSVESTDQELTIDGVHKSCINYPSEKRILVNRKDWLEITQKNREALVLHEYLGLLRIPDPNYAVSGQLLDLKFKKLSCMLVFVCKTKPEHSCGSVRVDSARGGVELSQRMFDGSGSWPVVSFDLSKPLSTEVKFQAEKLDGYVIFDTMPQFKPGTTDLSNPDNADATLMSLLYIRKDPNKPIEAWHRGEFGAAGNFGLENFGGKGNLDSVSAQCALE